MENILVTIPQQSITYPIHVGYRALAEYAYSLSLQEYSKVICIVDDVVMAHYEAYIRKSLRYVNAIIPLRVGEKDKSINTVQSLWQRLSVENADRKSVIINIGGGITGDVGGFVASTYMRGLTFMQIPTTLLSMVDASIGGKVGVNHGTVKNLIGAFQQPTAVLIDTSFLTTLPQEELQSGFVEMIKHGIIYDEDFVTMCERYLKSNTAVSLNIPQLTPLISRAIKIKQDVVEKDSKEASIRKILNFGHTIGHAIESHSHDVENPLLHGQAVGIGMIVESAIADKLGSGTGIHKEVLLLISKIGIPVKYPCSDVEAVMKYIYRDKKNVSGKVLMSLVDKVGSCTWNVEVSDDMVRYGLRQVME